MLTATEVWDEAALASLIAGATLLGSDLKVGLYTNSIAPTKKLTIADLVEPTFGGYARQLVVMGPVFRDPINGIASIAAALNWQMTGAPVPTIVVGCFYVYGAGPALLGIDPFPTPIGLNDDLDAFQTALEYVQSSQMQGFTTILS